MRSPIRKTQKSSHILRAMVSVSALASPMLLSPAYAQQAESESYIGEIVVTAQKRSENIQDVPIAITALDGAMMEDRGVNNPQALQYVTPGLVFTDNPTGVGMVTVRGVGGSGSRGSAPGQNPAVPVHANGVYLQSPAVMLQDFLDIDRVEVLRGPQGTLYGRNAVGGSVNVITKRPTKDLEGEVAVEIGNYNQRKVIGIISGPISERLRARLAVSMEDRDGFVQNVVDKGDDELLNSNYSNIRATIEYDLTPDAMVTVTGYRYRKDGTSYAVRPRALPPVSPGPSLYNNVPPGYQLASFTNSRRVNHDTRGDGYDKTTGISGELTWDIGNVTLRAITGYFEMETNNVGDADGTDLPNVHSESFYLVGYKSFSQELQLASSGDSALKWQVGAYYYNEDSLGKVIADASAPSNVFPYYVQVDGDVKSESAAVFGQVDYEIADALTLTGGLRYTHDSISSLRSLIFIGPVFTLFPKKASWSKVTWKLGAKYELSPSAMMYASYSRGYKAGGFNLSDNNLAFNPEIVDAYEVGFKVDTLDRMLRINASAFYYDYTDKQELSTDAVGFSMIGNAGAATLYGGELEMVLAPMSGLSFDSSVAYLHSEYDRYDTLDLENPFLGSQNLKGNTLTEAPKWQIHVGGQYSMPLSDTAGSVMLRADYSFMGSKYVRPFNLPTDKVESYGRTSARIAWTSANDKWTVEAFVDNIENKDIVTSFAGTSPLAGNIHQEVFLNPRTYGLKTSYRF